MGPAVDVPVDPAAGGVLGVGDSLTTPGVEDGGADALGLLEAVDGLHQRVVLGIADRPVVRNTSSGRWLTERPAGWMVPVTGEPATRSRRRSPIRRDPQRTFWVRGTSLGRVGTAPEAIVLWQLRATDVVLCCSGGLRLHLQGRKVRRFAHYGFQPVTPVVVADVAGEERHGVLPHLAPPAETSPRPPIA